MIDYESEDFINASMEWGAEQLAEDRRETERQVAFKEVRSIVEDLVSNRLKTEFHTEPSGIVVHLITYSIVNGGFEIRWREIERYSASLQDLVQHRLEQTLFKMMKSTFINPKYRQE